MEKIINYQNHQKGIQYMCHLIAHEKTLEK